MKKFIKKHGPALVAITVITFAALTINGQTSKKNYNQNSYIPKDGNQNGYIPKDGFVPNKETAIKIAEAIWLPIYGPDVENERPFEARLKDGKSWIIEGTLAKGMDGGVAYIEIQKSDGKILKVIHGK